jgi:ribosomal protein L12E/L44/L45/RPP1/RPP2
MVQQVEVTKAGKAVPVAAASAPAAARAASAVIGDYADPGSRFESRVNHHKTGLDVDPLNAKHARSAVDTKQLEELIPKAGPRVDLDMRTPFWRTKQRDGPPPHTAGKDNDA